MSRTQAIEKIAHDLEKRINGAGVRADAAGFIHTNLYTMAEHFIALYSDMQKAVEAGKKNHPMDRDFLQLAAREVAARLPDQWAFILFCFEPVENGRVMYVANTERAQAVAALKAWLLKTGPEEWLKHIE